LVGEAEGKKLFGRPRRRWEGNIRTDLKEIRWGILDWIRLAYVGDQWRALVNIVLNLWIL
jgi:hypothetical protein